VGQEHGHQFRDVAGDAFGNSISSLNWFDMRLVRGLSDFNVAEHLLSTETWDIPTANHSPERRDGLRRDGNLEQSSRSATAYRSRQRGALAMIPLLPKTMTTGLFRIGSAGPDAKTHESRKSEQLLSRLSALQFHRTRCCLLGCE